MRYPSKSRTYRTPRDKRTNSGDEILVHITAKNRTVSPATLELTASLEDLLLCDKRVLNVPGTPAGDTPQVVTGTEDRLFLYNVTPPTTPGRASDSIPENTPSALT